MTEDEFLTALYQGLLGRTPDPQGMEQHRAHLAKSGDDVSRYARMAAAFAASTEFQLTQHLRNTHAPGNFYLPDMGGVVFEHGLSLGSFCHAAMALKRAGIRSFSTPFDWIFSSADMVASCVEDDFERFLDPREYLEVPVDQRQEPHINLCQHMAFLAEFRVPFVFNHHKPFESDHYAYFQRCVERFRRVLKQPGWVLFMIVLPHATEAAKLKRLLNALRARCDRFVLLAVNFVVHGTAEGSSPPPRVRSLRAGHDLLMLEIGVAELSDGVTFRQPQDNLLLERVLRSFRFRT